MELYDYQVEGVNWLNNQHRCILADDMGLGKTPQAIVAANVLDVEKTLVFCPGFVKQVWIDEITQWDPCAKVVVLDSKTKNIEELVHSEYEYLIINYELLIPQRRLIKKFDELGNPIKVTKKNARMLELAGYLKVDSSRLDLISSLKWDRLILDEAHRIRNRNSQSYLAVKNVIKHSPKVDIHFLTGTPMLNKASDVWALLHLIDSKKFSSYWRFVKTYCEVTPAPWDPRITLVSDTVNTDLLRQHLEPYFLRRTKADQLHLPPVTYQSYDLEMDSHQRRMDKQMKKESYTEINDKVIEAVNPLAVLTYRREIATSPDLLDKDSTQISGPKIDFILNLLEDIGDQKVVIFSQYTRAIMRFYAVLKKNGYNIRSIIGKDSYTLREQQRLDFQNDPQCQIMLANIEAAGVGISLTAASIVIFLDFTWTPALNKQALDRVDRIGQTKPITCILLLMQDSVDYDVLRAVRRKQDLFDASIPTINPNKQQ